MNKNQDQEIHTGTEYVSEKMIAELQEKYSTKAISLQDIGVLYNKGDTIELSKERLDLADDFGKSDTESITSSFYHISQEMLDNFANNVDQLTEVQISDKTDLSPDTLALSLQTGATSPMARNTFVTITYGGNGHTHGTVPANHNIVTPSQGMLRPQGTMQRTNHSFLGWQTNLAPGSVFPPNVNISFTGTGTIPFTAAWQLNQVVIRYNGNGHTGGFVPAQQTVMTPATVATQPQGNMVRTGFVFLGWRMPDGRILNPGGSIQFEATFGEIVLTAVWEPAELTMSFNGNGNTGGTAPANITFQTPGSRNLPNQNNLVRTNHNFLGWLDRYGYVSNPGTILGVGTTINASSPMRGNIPFFAAWQTQNATITNPAHQTIIPHENFDVTWAQRTGVTYTVSLYRVAQGNVEISPVRLINRQQPSSPGRFAINSNLLTADNIYMVELHSNSVHALSNVNRSVFGVTASQIPTNDQMIHNLANDTGLALSRLRRDTMVAIGRDLLNNNFQPAFVAGVLANVMGEGDFGQFEIAGNPLSGQQSYLSYVVNNHQYRERFSGQHIYNINVPLTEIRNIIANRINTQGTNVNLFGLGALQWTNGTRVLHLVDNYIAIAGSGSITREQVIQSENLTLRQQLSGQGGHNGAGVAPYNGWGWGWHSNLHDRWISRHNSNLNTVSSAIDASRIITIFFVRPGGTLNAANIRSIEAENIFRVMMGL